MNSQSRSNTETLENVQVSENELQININAEANDDDSEKHQQQQHLATERLQARIFLNKVKKEFVSAPKMFTGFNAIMQEWGKNNLSREGLRLSVYHHLRGYQELIKDFNNVYLKEGPCILNEMPTHALLEKASELLDAQEYDQLWQSFAATTNSSVDKRVVFNTIAGILKSCVAITHRLYRLLTPQEKLMFLTEQVKIKFVENPEVSSTFKNIMQAYEICSINKNDLKSHLTTLFKDYPDILYACNEILPPDCYIEYKEDEEEEES